MKKEQAKKIIENFVRKEVRKSLNEAMWAPAIEEELKTIERYTEWLLDLDRKNTDKDLDKYIELLQKSLRKLVSSRRQSK